jgi:hypothetical protein
MGQLRLTSDHGGLHHRRRGSRKANSNHGDSDIGMRRMGAETYDFYG